MKVHQRGINTFLLFTLGAAGLLCCSSAQATTARLMPVAELIRDARLVVLGQCVERHSYWQSGRIYTRNTVVIDEVWRTKAYPRPSHTLEFTTLGGVVGSIAQHVDAAGELPPGQRAALFLGLDDRGVLRPVGLSQGIFFIEATGTAEKLWRPNLARHTVPHAVDDAPTHLAALKSLVLSYREP